MQIAGYFLEHSEHRDRHVQEVKEGSAYLQEQLNKLELRWYGGNYTNGILIFLKDKEASSNLVAYLRERGIYIRGSFDFPFEATIRVSIGSIKYMEQFLNSLRKWLK